MALIIRDAAVDALAEEVRRLIKAKTKTQAVRLALERQIDEVRKMRPLEDRLARSMALADAMGPNDPDFDMKAFADAMWDGA
ncbi:type II toxin-antitoxin system VapB family antitoxin [Jiella sp. M17.18]|uniref:type II toxin-antitoxin system VapB family antitoxin n=1 Tax=Jiella sp. M17.18 TaxID=3234247 RepID=UPI0034E04267